MGGFLHGIIRKNGLSTQPGACEDHRPPMAVPFAGVGLGVVAGGVGKQGPLVLRKASLPVFHKAVVPFDDGLVQQLALQCVAVFGVMNRVIGHKVV